MQGSLRHYKGTFTLGKPKDPDYWKKYRAAHPKYTEREKARSKARDRSIPRDRTAEYAKRKSRAVVFEPIPTLHQGHEIFERARIFLKSKIHPDNRTAIYDPAYEETLSEVVLAILENNNPSEGFARIRAYNLGWKSHMNTGSFSPEDLNEQFIFEATQTKLILDGSVW